MAGFEDIPEDREESYPCDKCDNGIVALDDSGHWWVCDSCDFCVVLLGMNKDK